MGQRGQQLAAVMLLLAGESLAVWAEVGFACDARPGGWRASLRPYALLMALATVGLLGGYRWCTQLFGDIWMVGVLSIVTILVAEPVVTWAISHQAPGWRAAAGLALGALGLAVAASGH